MECPKAQLLGDPSPCSLLPGAFSSRLRSRDEKSSKVWTLTTTANGSWTPSCALRLRRLPARQLIHMYAIANSRAAPYVRNASERATQTARASILSCILKSNICNNPPTDQPHSDLKKSKMPSLPTSPVPCNPPGTCPASLVDSRHKARAQPMTGWI